MTNGSAVLKEEVMRQYLNQCTLQFIRTIPIIIVVLGLTSCSPISVAVRPQEQTVEAGGFALFDIDILRISYQGPVSLGLSPATSQYYSTTLQPNTVTGNHSQLRVQVTKGAPIGAF
jgi:hypothetical protein